MLMQRIGAIVVTVLWMCALGLLIWRVMKRRGGHIGPAASGTIYEMLNEDKRKAVELIVEEKTGERDPERATGKKKPGSRGSTGS